MSSTNNENNSSNAATKIPSAAVLVNIGNRVAKPENQKVTTEEKTEYRSLLYEMRDTAGEILSKYKFQVCKCGKIILPKSSVVDVVRENKTGTEKNNKRNNSFYQNLNHCSSIWICPFCSMKISQERCDDVYNIYKNVVGGGGNSMTFVLTLPHYFFNRYKDLQNGIKNAWKFIVSHRTYKEACKEFNFIGWIKSVEVTHGKNGFHPHLHISLSSFCDQLDLEIFSFVIYNLWKKSIEKLGFGNCEDFLFRPQIVYNLGEKAAEYITKWQAAEELVLGNKKEGHKSQRNFFQILKDLTNNKKMIDAFEKSFRETIKKDDMKILSSSDNIEEIAKGTIYEKIYFDYKQDKKIYTEYALGSKGVRQLTWSKDFKKSFLSKEEKTDEQITADSKNTKIEFSIDRKFWQIIVHHKLYSNILIEYDKTNNINSVIKNLNIILESYYKKKQTKTIIQCELKNNTLVLKT